MPDESEHCDRPLRAEETALLAALTGALAGNQVDLNRILVEDMADGGMGSIRFKNKVGLSRAFGKIVAEAAYVDADGVIVNIVVNEDERGDLYELDFWKVDFSPLLTYPKPEQIMKRQVLD